MQLLLLLSIVHAHAPHAAAQDGTTAAAAGSGTTGADQAASGASSGSAVPVPNALCMVSGFRPGEHATGVGPAVQLAWRLTHPTRGVRQQAFELEIDGPAGLRWRSGRVPSALQRADTAELAAELRLPAGAVFRWRARAHLSTVGRSGEQVVAVLECESTFETAPPASAFPGSAKWIGGGGQLHATKGLVLPANASVASARAFVSGVGAFYLYVNGAQVGDHVMDPPQTCTRGACCLRPLTWRSCCGRGATRWTRCSGTISGVTRTSGLPAPHSTVAHHTKLASPEDPRLRFLVLWQNLGPFKVVDAS